MTLQLQATGSLLPLRFEWLSLSRQESSVQVMKYYITCSWSPVWTLPYHRSRVHGSALVVWPRMPIPEQSWFNKSCCDHRLYILHEYNVSSPGRTVFAWWLYNHTICLQLRSLILILTWIDWWWAVVVCQASAVLSWYCGPHCLSGSPKPLQGTSAGFRQHLCAHHSDSECYHAVQRNATVLRYCKQLQTLHPEYLLG